MIRFLSQALSVAAMMCATSICVRAELACSRAPAKRFVLAWDGVNDASVYENGKSYERYARSVESTAAILGRGADRCFVAFDGRDLEKDTAGVLRFRDRASFESSAKQTTIFNADPGALSAIENVIHDEASKLPKGQRLELSFVVTNHGFKSDGEVRIAGSPVPSPGTRASADFDSSLSESRLRDFGRQLPANVDLKLIFGECGSYDSARALLEGYAERGVGKKDNDKDLEASCACSFVLSEPGWVANEIGNEKDSWEGALVNAYARGRSPSAWRATTQAMLDSEARGANASRTTSESLVVESLAKKAAAGAFGMQPPFDFDDPNIHSWLEKNAQKIVNETRSLDLKGYAKNVESQALIESSRAERYQAACDLLGRANDKACHDQVDRIAQSTSADAEDLVRALEDPALSRLEKQSEEARHAFNSAQDQALGALEDRQFSQADIGGVNRVVHAANALVAARNADRVDEAAQNFAAAFEALKETQAFKSDLDSVERMKASIPELVRLKRAYLLANESFTKANEAHQKAVVLRDPRRTLPRQSPEQRNYLVSRLMARGALEEAFFRTANDDELRRFFASRRCELEPLVRDEATLLEEKGGASPRPHQKETN
jgi:hypothetical protein